MNKENRKNKKRERGSIEKGKHKALEKICLLDHESSVEVGYGFSYEIRSKLLIANDMYVKLTMLHVVCHVMYIPMT